MNCPYCNAKPFKSKRGLTLHQQNSTRCTEAIRAKYGTITGKGMPHNFVTFAAILCAINANAVGSEKENLCATKNGISATFKYLRVNQDIYEQLAKRQRTDTEAQESETEDSYDKQTIYV